ncbi:MAG TPA: ATP-binding protein [Gemmataceae bacterium]|nr:ATP-binding protein [Gemmataceae bacterium]
MTTLSSLERPVERDGDALTAFFECVLSSNPFIDNRVTGLAADALDVAEVHGTAFDQLTELARQARDLRRGVGAVLWGEAGVGKSHLLSRLLRWAERDGRAVAVYLHNLQARPDNLPRSLLKAVVSILTRGRAHGFRDTPLFRLTLSLLAEALRYDKTRIHPWDIAERAYEKLLDGLAAEDPTRAALADRTIYNVLYRFLRSAYRCPKTRDDGDAALAARWLSGDALDAAEGRRIGLPPGRTPDEPTALADDQQIKQVLVALSRAALAGNTPFLLCFDQVDNLNDDQAAALSRFLEAVIDSAPNLLVVTAGVQATLLRWRELRVFQDSAWDRLTQFEVALQRLNRSEARRIVAARLEKIVTPFVEAEPVRRRLHEDDLFPLGRRWEEIYFRDRLAVRPRDVINGAREGWSREQESLRKLGGAVWLEQWGEDDSDDGLVIEWTAEQIREAIDRKTAEKIQEYLDEHRPRLESLPADAAHLTGLLAALIRQAGGFDVETPPAGKADEQHPFSLVVRRRPGGASAGLLVLVEHLARTVTFALRYILSAADRIDRILLVTDDRAPLVFGKQPDAKGKQHYEELRNAGPGRFRHINLSGEQYLQLNALEAVTGLARSLDLEIELPGGRTRLVSEEEAIESHRRQGRYASAPVLGDLLTEAPAP